MCESCTRRDLNIEQKSPVTVNTIGLEFDCELSNFCLINGSAGEAEGTVEICNHIFSQDLSASLCLPLSRSPFTINSNFNKDRTKLYTRCSLGRGNKWKTTNSLKRIKQKMRHCSLYLFNGCSWPPIFVCATGFDLGTWEPSSVTIATLSLAKGKMQRKGSVCFHNTTDVNQKSFHALSVFYARGLCCVEDGSATSHRGDNRCYQGRRKRLMFDQLNI